MLVDSGSLLDLWSPLWIWLNQQHPSFSAKPTLVQDASTYLRAEVEPFEDDDVSEDTKEQQDGPWDRGAQMAKGNHPKVMVFQVDYVNSPIHVWICIALSRYIDN